MTFRHWLVPAGVAVLVVALVGGTSLVLRGSDDPPRDATDDSALQLRPIALAGYLTPDPTHLTLIYATGLPECDGRIDEPRVLETADAVRVELLLRPVDVPPDTPCPEMAQVMKVEITLAAPLGDRVVRDASQDGAIVPPGDPMSVP